MTIRVLIIADDLTGALDSAAGFADGSRSVVVARSPEAVPEALRAAPDVLAINTSSRETAPPRAARRVEAAFSQLAPDAASVIFKKVDSRLKGNVATETAVLARLAQRARQVACPAIPDMRRIVVNGALSGAGVATPVPVAAHFGNGVEVADATTDTDLDALLAEGLEDTLWIGARGLAFALARALGAASPRGAQLRGPTLIVNGSRDPITIDQIAALADMGSISPAPDGVVPDIDARDGPLVLTITDGGEGVPGHIAARRLAEGSARVARRLRPASILFCGGESANACLDQLGVNSLRVTAELRPGLPLGETQMDWGPVQIATKSGGFGVRNTLAEILKGIRHGQ
ncbi:four-carbon acid sugar kinase family protein [Chelativorans intermedius]|uniref:Four-carbon acid sugar kinase family protein n=1 Tax=Chelativorans intermedius TaxID=515947 RepID=A0ABV6D602_9HYPH|nr:four-carbon acid sugar kinase family protein [Chelativorans intermedius]MCT8997464.1 four-carbon acid sugar kinase family protein [Chelativorans intermedius]